MEPMEIIHTLRKARGSNRKLEILKQHKDNYHWQWFLQCTYDTSINYYVSAPKDSTFVDSVDMKGLIHDLKELSSKAYVGNKARLFALDCSKQYGEIFRLALGGSIRAGVSFTTINKAYPGLIPVFPLMLAKDVEIKKYPVYASTKYDGVRVLVKVTGDGYPLIFTRSGKLLDLHSLKIEMNDWPNGWYDGELVHGNGLQAGRSRITGDVNKCLKGTSTEIDNYKFCIFDRIPLRDWAKKQSSSTFNERLEVLSRMDTNRITNIHIVNQVTMEDAQSVNELYAERIAKGFEGLILRYGHDPYVWDRTKLLIKKKATEECVLTCVDIQEGTGKYEGMIGALICEGYVLTNKVNVKVGSGLSDDQRSLDNSMFLDKKIEVLYNDLLKRDKSNDYSLFLPRFKRLVGGL